MRQSLKPHQTKVSNQLGEAFHNVKPSTKLRYKAALIDAGERRGRDYWRAFRDVWQYSEHIDDTPYIIVRLATDILGYVHGQTNNV